MLPYHDNNIKTALNELFPNLETLNITVESPHSIFYIFILGGFFLKLLYYLVIILCAHTNKWPEYWTKPENRRRFFEEYAASNNFDPLIAENWYLHPITKIASTKVPLHSLIPFISLTFSSHVFLTLTFPNLNPGRLCHAHTPQRQCSESASRPFSGYWIKFFKVWCIKYE